MDDVSSLIFANRYLEDPRWGYINQSIAKYRMAEICTTYLTLDCFTKISSDKELATAAQRGDYAFQDYAVCNWYYHVQALKDSDNSNLVNMEGLFLLVREVLTLHYQKLEVISNLIHDQNQNEEPISLGWAALTELSRACSELESIDETSERGCMYFLSMNCCFLRLTGSFSPTTRNLRPTIEDKELHRSLVRPTFR
jgi:hypothetical protein